MKNTAAKKAAKNAADQAPVPTPDVRGRWTVKAVPEGEKTIGIGAVRAGLNAEVRLTKEQAEQLNANCPGCVVFAGI